MVTGTNAHCFGSIQGRDRQRHQCLRRSAADAADRGTLTLNANGTFTYVPVPAPTTFTYCANGTVTAGACSSGITATVTLGAATIEAASGITCQRYRFTRPTWRPTLSIKPPGILANCKDAAGYPLTVNLATLPRWSAALHAESVGCRTAASMRRVAARRAPAPTFTFKAQNSQGTLSAAPRP